MAKNVKALTPVQLRAFLDKYRIVMTEDGNNCVVTTNTMPNRKVIHSIEEKFNVSIATRKLLITPMAFKIWNNMFHYSHTIIEVQNACNYLLQMCQSPYEYGLMKDAIKKFKYEVDVLDSKRKEKTDFDE